jgi:hypothetical protein
MYTKIVKAISKLSARQAGEKLKSLYHCNGPDYVKGILYELQDFNTDDWWLATMEEAGEEVKKLY